MEREALHRVGPRSVFFVADDRTSGVSQLDTDLVTASGHQGQLNECPPRGARQDSVMRDGMPRLGAARSAVDFEGVRFIKV